MSVKFLHDLVAIPTVAGDFEANNEGLNYIESFLRKRGMFINRHEYDGHGTLVATTRKTKHPKVMLVSHIDVVPGPKKLFTLEEKDGKLYGRGTFDMKHAAAAFLGAVEELGEEVLKYDFGIMIFTDDESTDTQTKKLLEDGYSCDVAVLPDGSSDWQIESTAKGVIHVRVKINGKSSHGSRPWEGDSASLKMIDFLHELMVDFVDHGPETNTLNIGWIQSGSHAWNQLPEAAEATLDIRVLDFANEKTIRKRLSVLAKKYKATIEEAVSVPPLVHDLNNRYLATFATCIKEVTGVTSKGYTSLGTHDGQYFLARGIPCIVVSPPGGGRHSDEEWIEKKGMELFPKVMTRFLQKVADK
jgi:succinyl-diaminopimelate desuccinylase